MTEILRAAFVAGLILTGATPSGRTHPSVTETVAAVPAEVRVVNNHTYRIRVVVVDARGRHHSLGRVMNTQARIFALDEDLVGAGPLSVKVFADEPVWSAANSDEAIRTQELSLNEGDAVYVWVEADLTRSQIVVGR